MKFRIVFPKDRGGGEVTVNTSKQKTINVLVGGELFRITIAPLVYDKTAEGDNRKS